MENKYFDEIQKVKRANMEPSKNELGYGPQPFIGAQSLSHPQGLNPAKIDKGFNNLDANKLAQKYNNYK